MRGPFPRLRRNAPVATPVAEPCEQQDARPQDHPQAGGWQRPDGAARGTASGAPLPAKVLIPDPPPTPAPAGSAADTEPDRPVPVLAISTAGPAERPAARTDPDPAPVPWRVESPRALADRIDAELEENLREANRRLRGYLRQAEAMLAVRDGVSVHDLRVPWPKQTPRAQP